MKPRSPFQLVRKGSRNLAIVLFSLLAANAASATSLNWDLNGAADNTADPITGLWDGTNIFWNDDATGGAGGLTTATTSNLDDLIISSSGIYTAGTVTLSGARVASSISFKDDIAVILSGGTSLTLGGTGAHSGIFVLLGDNAANTVSTPIILDASTTALTFSNAGTGLLTIGNGTLTGSATTGIQTLTLSSTGSGDILLSGVISNGGGGGSVALNINNPGSGATTLSGANSYTGLTTISAGTLKLGATGSATNTPLGTIAAGTTVLVTGALDLNGFPLGTAEALTLNGTGVSSGGALTNSGAAASYSGAVTLASDSSIGGSNGTLTLSGVISGNFNLTKVGSDTLILSNAANTFGSGTTTFTIGAGTVQLGSVTTSLGVAANKVAVTSGAVLDANGKAYATLNALTLNGSGIGGTGALINGISTAGSYAGPVSLASASTIGNAGTALFTVGGNITGTAGLTIKAANTGGITLTNVNNTGTIINSGGSTGTTTLTTVGSTVTGVTQSSITSPLTLTTVALGSSQSWTNNGATLTANGVVTGGANTLTLDGTGAGLTTLTGGLSFTGAGGLVIGKSGTLGTTISGGTITLGGTSGISINSGASAVSLGAASVTTPQSWTNSSSNAMSQTGVLALGANTLTLAGGNFTFSQTNTGTGSIALNAGNLIATAAGAFGPSTEILTFGGGNLELRSAAITYTGSLNMANNGGTITINPASSGNGVTDIIGTLNIGAQQLSLVAGSLTTTGTAYGLTAGATTLSGNAIFDVANNGVGLGTLTLGALNQSGGPFTITKQGVGTLALGTAANASFTGSSITITNGVLSSNFAGALSSVATTANTTTVTVNNASGELKGTVAGSFKSSGTGTPSEAITLSGGTLRLANAAAADFGGNLTYTSGSLILDRTASGATNIDAMGSLSIGAVTLTPTQVNYTAAPTLAFNSTTLTGNATLDSTNVIFSLGNLTLSGATSLTTQGTKAVTIGTLTLPGNMSFTNNSPATLTLGAVTGAANTLTLDGTGAGLTTLTGGLTFSGAGGLVIGKSGTNGVTLNGGTITLGGTGGLTTNNGSSAVSLGAASITADQSWTNNSSTTMTASGILALTNKLTLAGGTFSFGGANTGSGGIALNGGTLIGTVAGALGPNTNTVTFGGGNLELRSGAITYTGLLNMAGSGGTLTINPASSGAGVTDTIGTLNIGAKQLSLVAGSLTTTGTAYGLTAGATTLSGNAIFDVANNGVGVGTLTLGALGDGGTGCTLTKQGAGALTLNTAGTLSASSQLTLNAGTINQGATNALGTNSPTLSITPTAGTGLYNISGVFTQTLGLVTLGGASGTTANITTGTGTVTLGGNVTYDATSNPNASTISGPLNVGTTQKTFAIGDSSAAADDLTVSAVIANGVGGSILKSGLGTLVLSGANTAYTGGIALNQGLLVGTAAGSFGAATSTVTFGGGNMELRNDTGTTFTALANMVSSGATITVNRATAAATATTHILGTLNIGAQQLSLAPGGFINTNTAYGLTFGATTLSGNAIFDVANNGTGIGTLTLGALNTNSGARTITKQGAGTLMLAAASGVITTGTQINVTNGVLASTVAGALSNTATTANTTTVAVSSTGELKGTMPGSFKSSGTGTPSEAITLSGGTLRLYSNTAVDFGGNLTYSGGSLILDRTASGVANIDTMGTLSIGAVTLTPTQVNYTTVPTLAFNGATTLTGNPLFDTTNANITLAAVGDNGTPRTLTKQGGGLLTIGGALTVNSGATTTLTDSSGGLTLSGGVANTSGNLILNNNSAIAGGITLSTTAVNNIGTLTNSGSGSGPTLVSAVIGAGVTGVIQNSTTSNLSLSGVNTYAADTTITNGVLDISGAGSLGSGGTYANNISIANGGLLLFNSTATQIISGVIGTTGTTGGLTKLGTGLLTLKVDNPLAGAVTVMGSGGLKLMDAGKLASASGFTLKNTTLTIDNTGTNINNRLSSAAIRLDGGGGAGASTFTYTGAPGTASTESLGAVTANSGLSGIRVNAGTSGSAVVTMSSLARTAGAALVLNNEAAGFLGSAGNNPRLMLSGGLASLTGNLAPVNGVIPGLFFSNTGGGGRAFVNYDNTLGFTPVTSTAGSSSSTATQNVTGVWSLTGSQAVNSILSSGGTFAFASANDTLTVTSGMIFPGQDPATLFGTTTVRGALTTGPDVQELMIMRTAQGSGNPGIIFNSVIKDNGNPVKLVTTSPFGTNAVSYCPTLTAANSYTGGTSVSGGLALLLAATIPGDITVPYSSGNDDAGGHGLVIDNGTVKMNTNAGQIDPRNTVTLNGTAVLTLVGNNTLAGLIFNSDGGTPSITPTGILSITGNITSTPSSPTVVPLISGGTLDLKGSTSHNITVAALPNNLFGDGLNITSVIQNGGFNKKGDGVLALSPAAANLIDGDITVTAGRLKVGTVNAMPNGAGKGNLVLNATLDLNALSSTINGLSGSGTVDNLSGVANYTLTAGGNDQTSTFSGVIKNSTGTVALTKSGRGTLTLSGTNTYSGATTISAGTLLISGASALPGTGVVTVQTGGTLALTDGAVLATTVGGLTLAGPATLGFDWSSSTADLLTTAATATTSGNVGIALNLAGSPTGPVTLIHAADGLSAATYYLANNTNFTAALTKTATDVTASSYAAATALTSAYWYGNVVTGAVSAMALSKADGTASNWSTASGSYVATPLVPGATTDVIFSATGATQQAAIVAGAAMSVNSLTFNDSIAVTIGGGVGESITLNSTGTGAASAISANQNATLNTGLILGNAGTFTFTSAGTKLLTVGGPLSGAGALTLAGSGTTVFSGANSYAGDTTISGKLKLGASNVIPDGMGKGNVTLSGTLDMGGFSDTLNGLTGAGIVDNSTGAGIYTLSVGGNNQSIASFTGTIQNTSGKVALTKVGSGTFTLASTDTYAGDTTVSDGVLKISAANSIPSGTGKGNVAVNGVGILDLNGLSPTINGLTGTGYLDNLNSSATGSYTLSVGANDQTSNFGGSIRNTYGTVGLIKTGTGTLTLSNGNAYTGVTNISAGTLLITHAAALSNTSAINLVSGARLEVNVAGLSLAKLNPANGGSGVVTGSFLRLTTANLTGVSPGTIYGTLEWSANVPLDWPVTLGTGGTMQSLTSNQSYGGGSITLLGDATLLADVGMQFNLGGNPVISAGSAGTKILYLGGTSTGGNNVGGSGANNQIQDGSGQIALTKIGAGTWNLFCTNSQYTGATTLTQGILKASVTTGGTASSIGKSSSAAINLILNGGTLQGFGTTDRLFTITGGTTTSALDTTAGALTFNAAGSIVISGTDTAQTLTLTGTNAGTLTPVLPDNGAGQTSLAKTAAGTWALAGSNTYSGGTTLTLGTLQAGAAENAGVSGPFGKSGSIVFNGGTLQFSNTNRFDYSGRFTTLGNNPYSIDTNSQGVTFATGLAASGSSGLTKVGAGTLTLAAANAYTGTTTVSGGTLAISSLATLGNGSVALTLSGGALDLGGTTNRTVGALSITAAATSDYTIKNGSLTGTSYAASLTTGNAMVSASLLGSGITLAKSGAGTLTLAGTNAYTGATTLTAGMLQSVNAGGLSGTASVTVSNAGSVLAVNYGGASDYSPAQISTLLAKTTFSANTTAFGFDTSNASGPATYGNVLAMAAGLTKLGVGTLVLDQANTYTGTTNVNLGTLVLAGDNSGAAGATSDNSGAFLRVGAANNFTAGTLTMAGGTLQLRNDADTNFGKAFTLSANSTVDVDRASGTSTNHLLTMGTLSIGAQTLTATGRNGYGLGLGATTLTGAATLNAFATNMAVASVTGTNQSLILAGRGTNNSIGPITTGIGTLTLGYNTGTIGLVGTDATWTLTGTSTYTGVTNIYGGKLIVNGSIAAGSAVTIGQSAFLGGTGTVSGNITANNGGTNSNAYVPGGSISLVNGSVGTLAVGGNLTFSGAAATTANHLFFDLGNGAAGTDKITVAGTFNTTATAGTVAVFLNQLSGGAVNAGTYTLIQGGAAGANKSYVLGTTRAGGNLYSALGVTGNNLQVAVAAGTAGDAVDNLYWKGDTTVWNTAQWYSNPGLTTVAASPGYQSNVRIASSAGGLTHTFGQDYEINSLTVDSGIGATGIGNSDTKMLTIDATTANNNTAGRGITVNNAAGTTIATTRIGLGSSQTWYVGSGASLNITAEIGDFGNGYTLTKDGPGDLTLNRFTTYTGGTVVNGGRLILTLPGIGDMGVGLRGSLTINTGATVVSPATLGYAANGGVAGDQLSVININGGTLDRNAGSNSTTMGITFNMTGGTITHSATNGYWQMAAGSGLGQNVFNILPSSNSSVISGAMGFGSYDTQFNVADGDAAVDLLVSGHLNTAGGSYGLIKNGAGLMALTFNNSTSVTYSTGTLPGYTGLTTINAGTLQLGNGGTTGNLNPASTLVDNATLAFNRTNTLTQGADFNSVISGAGGILQAGTGATILNGSNTYTGVTSVSNGILSVRTQSALLGGTDAFTPAKISVESGAALVVGVGTAPTNFDASAIATVLNGTHLGASTATTGLKTGAQFGLDTTTASGGTFTYSNVLANLSGGNNLNFIKTGTGTLVLDQANTYTGTTTVNAGTLKLAQGGSLDATAVSVASGATYGVSQTSSGSLIGGASLALAGGALLDLQDTKYNTLAFSGAATLSGAALKFDIGTSAAQNDMLTFVGAATTSGTNLFSFNTPGGSAGLGTYTLISAPAGGLSLGNFGLNSPTLGSYSASLTGDAYNIYLSVQDVNNSKLWVGATAPTGSLETTSVTQAFGRVLQNSSPSANITLSSDGSQASVTNASVVAGGDATTTTGTGTISTRSPLNVGLITSTTGAKAGTITIANLATTTAGTSLGNDNGNATVNVSGTVVADRSSNITAALGDIGRQLTGATASLTGKTLSFTSAGANDLFTNVIIGSTTYNGTTTTGTLASQSASITSVASSGTATIAVAPTNAETDFSYTPATLTSASYTASVVASRAVNAPTTKALGTYHAGAAVNIPSNAFGYSYSGSGDGAQANTEDATVQAASLIADANGIVLSGGPNSISSAATFTRSFTGTALVSSSSGSISSVVNPEFSPATTVSAPYSIGVYSGDMVWSGASGSTWGTNNNWSDSVSGGAQVAPGNDSGFTGVDSATFGAVGNSAVTVGAAANLNALSFTGGTYTLSGSGILTLAQGGAKPTPSINVTSGTQIINAPLTLADNLAVSVSGTKLTLGGNLTGTSKTLTKSGGGILELAGTNNYGDTSVTAGTLLVNGSTTGNVTVTGGTSTLGGTGSITGALNVTGILAPGGSIVESLASTGNLTLNSGSTFAYQATSRTVADLMVVGGGLSLTSATLDLAGANLTAGIWALNNKLTLLSYTGTAVTGGFTNYIDDTSYLFGGNSWTINYNDTTKGTNTPTEATGDKFVTLKLTAVADYYTWATAKGLTGTAGSSTDPAPDADPDKDGATNLAEYAFNGNPLDGKSKGQVYSLQADTTLDGKKELILTVAVRANTQTFTTTGGSATAPLVDGITYSIEGSTTTLASASFNAQVTPVTAITTGLPALTDAVNYTYVSFRLEGSNGLTGKGFLRAKAVK